MITELPRETLLFDLGGVLIDFSGFDELGRLLPGRPSRAEVRDRWIRSPSVIRFERGEISSHEFADGVVRELGLDLSLDRFIALFVSWARGPYPGARSLLEQLRTRHRVACLSNSNALHTPVHRRNLEGVVDTFYFSDEIGQVKPDREVFEHVIRDLSVPPSHIVFFDDTPVNVEAARSAGLRAYEVDGIGALRAELHRLAVLGPPP